MPVFQALKKPIALTLLTLSICSCSFHHGQVYQKKVEANIEPTDFVSKMIDAVNEGLPTAWPSRASSHVAKAMDPVVKVKAEESSSTSTNLLTKAISHVVGKEEKSIKPAAIEIKKSAEEHGVPETLLAAVIHHESRFQHGVVSRAGAVGLSQIMPNVWSGVCKQIQTIPGNVDCGARVLKHYYDEVGSWEKALAYYNVGPGNYMRSTKFRNIGGAYAREVMKSQSKLERQLALLSSKS